MQEDSRGGGQPLCKGPGGEKPARGDHPPPGRLRLQLLLKGDEAAKVALQEGAGAGPMPSVHSGFPRPAAAAPHQALWLLCGEGDFSPPRAMWVFTSHRTTNLKTSLLQLPGPGQSPR